MQTRYLAFSLLFFLTPCLCRNTYAQIIGRIEALNGIPQTGLDTFTSLDGSFRFKHSPHLVNCLQRPTRSRSAGSDGSHSPSDSATPPEDCSSQGEICSGPGSDGTSLACFAFPKKRFADKSVFLAATFYVSEVPSARTAAACWQASSDWLLLRTRPGTTPIHGVAFKVFEIGDNWLGGGQSGPAYRAFHNRKCYELGVQTASSGAAFDPETDKPMTEKDWAEVEGVLMQALNSFVFLK